MRVGGPVGPERHDGDTVDVVAEAPGSSEVRSGRPLTGPAGIEFANALDAVGASRTSVALHHAVACAPPEGNLDRAMSRWKRANDQARREGKAPLPSPVECCRPRLLAELRHPHVVTLGRTALLALTGRDANVLDVRGGPTPGWLDDGGRFHEGERPASASGKTLRVLPTLHPSHVLKARQWSKAFRVDLARAFRWFSGRLDWTDPVVVRDPTPMQLVGFIERNRDQPIIFDAETTKAHPSVSMLKCVGLSTQTEAVVVHLLSIEGRNGSLAPGHYSSREETEVRRVLREFFVDPRIVKVGHNAILHDRQVIEQHFGVVPAPLLDTLLMHRSVEPELPHRLGYVGSVYTDVTSWKAAHNAKWATTDEELGRYCVTDCVVTARVLPVLAEAAKARGQVEVVSRDHRVQELCVGMHRTGLLIDRERVQADTQRTLERIAYWRLRAQGLSGRSEFKVTSTRQIRELLFSQWKLTPTSFTSAGDPATNDDALRLLRTQNMGNKSFVFFADALRRYRRAVNEFTFALRRLVPEGVPLDGRRFQSEEEQEESERGLIMRDGRVRPDFNAHGDVTGRVSSSAPNVAAWSRDLRGTVVAPDGHVLVSVTASDLSLRVLASVAKVGAYLEAFAAGRDPHTVTASLMFGRAFDGSSEGSAQWLKLRGIAEAVAAASLDGSDDEAVHGTVTGAEGENGELLYPDLTVREVSTLRRRWLDGVPELPRWWNDCVEGHRNNGYVLDPAWGRRHDFAQGGKFSEVVSFPVQAAGGAVLHEAAFDILQFVPFEQWGDGTGVVAQVGDSLLVEAPVELAEAFAREMERAMTRTVQGLDGVTFNGKATIGRRWGDV